ncbi:hypothetical protein [Ekhidna sp.]|jgi:hypothetical protein|uniref:hypothetical protein n=1 Tax=Ekhidna sp. TaxID=2608089 RepID=UPI0032EAF317|tara:strand:+ start:4836 stop:5447 length:612 start_codon:yes stop_codon:yes gene_type:complete
MIFLEANHLENFRAFWHLCYYFPKSRDEFYSAKLLDFKNGEEEAIQFWIDWVEHDFINEIYDTIRFGLIVRVLGHDELEVTEDKPLDQIGEIIADVKGSLYEPKVLGKKRANKKLSFTVGIEERQAAMEDNYYLADEEFQDYADNVLIIDDIKTSGTSLLAVQETLLEAGFSGRIYGFSLGLTEGSDLTKNDDIEVPELDDEL